MKIAVFIYSLAGGGAERQVSFLVPFLEKKGYEVFLVLMNKTIKYNFESKRTPFFLENSSADENSILKLVKLPVLAYKYSVFLKKNNIEKSISFLTRPNFIATLSTFFNKKWDIILSEGAHPSSQYGYKNLQSKINTFLIKKLYPRADLVRTNALENAADLKLNFNVLETKIKTLANPISLDFINNIQVCNNFFDPNYFNLVSIGRLDVGKNHDLLIQSFAALKSQKIRLYIFGDGILKTTLQKSIQKLKLDDCIFLMGFETNPYQYLKAADLFVFASNHEGFPNVLLEAMACELPIVTTNCPSGPNEIFEVFTDYNFTDNVITDYGVLVPRNNIKKMIEAINYHIQNKIYHQNCKTHVKKRVVDFEVNTILEKFEMEFINNK